MNDFQSEKLQEQVNGCPEGHEHSSDSGHEHDRHSNDHDHHSHDHDHPHSHTHSHDHEHDYNHEHPHEHTHSHEHTHTHEHAHTHEHTHTHEHSHTHSHIEETGMMRERKILEYMIAHNAEHAQEMRDLAERLREAGRPEAAALLLTAADGFDAANGGLKYAADFLE